IEHESTSLAVGDIDGDGRLDAATVSYDDSTLTTVLGDGAGGLRAQRDTDLGRQLQGVAIGDAGPGGPHLVLAAAPVLATVFVFQGGADGSLTPLDPFLGIDGPGALALRDLDGDGISDLIVAEQEYVVSHVTVTRGLGGGRFSASAGDGGVAAFDLPGSLAFGDVDGDGHTDIAVADQNRNTTSVPLAGGAAGPLSARRDANVTGRATSAALGDLDGDGRADLVVTSRNPGEVSVFVSDANGLRRVERDAVDSDPRGVVVADFDG